jgi:hypothetical protein
LFDYRQKGTVLSGDYGEGARVQPIYVPKWFHLKLLNGINIEKPSNYPRRAEA